MYIQKRVNARLRGWQRITPNSITTAETTVAQWDWKRHALTVPLEAFVSFVAYCFTMAFYQVLFGINAFRYPFKCVKSHFETISYEANKHLKRDCQRVAFPVPMSRGGCSGCV